MKFIPERHHLCHHRFTIIKLVLLGTHFGKQEKVILGSASNYTYTFGFLTTLNPDTDRVTEHYHFLPLLKTLLF